MIAQPSNKEEWNCKKDLYRWYLMIIGADNIILIVKSSIQKCMYSKVFTILVNMYGHRKKQQDVNSNYLGG
jgi:hypothetical protein